MQGAVGFSGFRGRGVQTPVGVIMELWMYELMDG